MHAARTSKRTAGRSRALLLLTMLAIVCGVTRQSVVHGKAAVDYPNSLPFSKQFLIPGNYVVGSVDLLPASQGNGFITGNIPVSGVPANADILAAYLYWETIST